MILGVDIGGTKTLIGLFDLKGQIAFQKRFPTPTTYANFLKEFENTITELIPKIDTVVVAAPGRIDRKTGKVVAFGNLPWKNIPLKQDVERITNKKVMVENDAKLAALAEASLISDKFDKILYLTFSTGIGAGLVYKGHLDEAMIDSEAGQMLLANRDEENKLVRWETMASGKALFKKYGKKASEIDDPKIWESHSYKMALGIVELCAVIEPDAIIIGGGVGSHFSKFDQPLSKSVSKLLPDLVKRPVLLGAKNAELASLLGCFEYANEKV